MICPDTSIWVEALRNAESPEAVVLSALLDVGEVALIVPVRIEILSGASSRDRLRLRRVLSALPLYVPDEKLWDRIDKWVDQAADAGERFGFADFLIVAIAAAHEAKIWSNDADFSRMARLGFIECYEPEDPRTVPQCHD